MIGTLIKLHRESLGYSVKKLCEQSGVKIRMLYSIEDGTRQPSFPTLTKLCEAMSLDFKIIIEPKK